MYAINNSSLPDGRAEAFIGQSAPQFATILLPAAIMLTWRSLHRPALWAMGGAMVVNLAIVLSATRSAWFGIAVAIAARDPAPARDRPAPRPDRRRRASSRSRCSSPRASATS